MKTYFKYFVRSFKKNVSRFISIVFIVAISVSLSSGIGSSSDKIIDSVNRFAAKRNVSDIIVKSKSESGFTDLQIQALKDEYGEENVDIGMSVDAYLDINGEQRLTRLVFSDNIAVRSVNKFSDVDYTVSDNENFATAEDGEKLTAVYAEKSDNYIKGYNVGDKIVIDFKVVFKQLAEQNGVEISPMQEQFLNMLSPVSLVVEKIVEDPLVFARDGEPSYLNGEDAKLPDTVGASELINVDDILYLPYSVLPLMKTKSDAYISLANKKNGKNPEEIFSPEYKEIVEREKENIENILALAAEQSGTEFSDSVAFLTLYENYTFNSVNEYSKKIRGLAIVLMVAFMFITALVVLSNVTRLMEEERSQTACLTTLGFSPSSIIVKYIVFVLAALVIGGAAAYFIGNGLCSFIYLVFNYSYAMPSEAKGFTVLFYLVTMIFMIVASLWVTLRVGGKTAKETPSELLKPKAPVAGKKVIIEKIPFIWNRLSFKYKSAARNVLRYKSRFVMTVAAVSGSMGLVAAGLALLDMCLFGDFGSASIAWLAVVVVAFAALLTLTAVYTITNISISERNREIATLMVLGYQDGEVCGYIYREIFIDAAVGVLLGYGVSAVLMGVVFSVMGFGSLGEVSWYVWLAAPVVVAFFTGVVAVILKKRIVSVDMNASLKCAE